MPCAITEGLVVTVFIVSLEEGSLDSIQSVPIFIRIDFLIAEGTFSG